MTMNYDQAPPLIREHIDAAWVQFLATKPPQIAAAWQAKADAGQVRIVTSCDRRRGRIDTRTMHVSVQALHSAGLWCQAFTLRLRGRAAQQLTAGLADAAGARGRTPNDLSTLEDGEDSN